MQSTRAALGESLVGEYLRVALAGAGMLYFVYWAVQLAALQPGALLLGVAFDGSDQTMLGTSAAPQTAMVGFALVGLFVACSAVLTGVSERRLLMWLVGSMAAIFLGVLAWGSQLDQAENLSPFSPLASLVYVFGTILLVAIRIKGNSESRFDESERTIRFSRFLIPAVIGALLLYMIAWPAVEWMLGRGEFGNPTSVGEQFTLGQEIRIRTAKLAVFLIFVAVGASFGSFLHVVADTIPRGQGIPLRSSACPVCNTTIRRLDNIPIISYLMLRGRCRDCGTEIPVRYLWAEVLMAILFASFFLLELVNGAANLPGFRDVPYTGIVWIILYTKWDVVGIVAFHLFLYATVLTSLFSNWQSHRVPWYYWGVAFVLGFSLPLVWLPLLPMKLVLPWDTSPVFINAMTSLAGGLAAMVCGAAMVRIFSWELPIRPVAVDQQLADDSQKTDITNEQAANEGASSLVLHRDPKQSEAYPSLYGVRPALILLGLGLGWQAVLGIVACVSIALGLMLGQRISRNWLAHHGLLPVLLVAAIIHHFTWKHLVQFGRPIWPGQDFNWLMVTGFIAVTFVGLFLISRGWKSYLLKVET